MRERVVLLAPVMSRLDHVRPALHRLSKIDGKDVDVRLIPLQNHTNSKLQIFCDFLKKQTSYGTLPGNHTVELIPTKDDFLMSNNWFSNWKKKSKNLSIKYSNLNRRSHVSRRSCNYTKVRRLINGRLQIYLH